MIMLNNPGAKAITLFKEYMNERSRTEDCSSTYYHRMLNVYVLFLKMKTYCTCEDYNLKNKNNFVNNEKLDLTSIKNNIIKEGNYSNISDKKLLQLIRDTFSHTTSDNELYHISVNGKIIEFKLQKPSPLTIKLSSNDIISLTTSINQTTQTVQMMGIEWDNQHDDLKDFLTNLKINRYYFTKKVNEAILTSIHTNSEKENYKEAITEAENVDNCIVKQLELTEKQIEEIVNTSNTLIQSGIISEHEYNSSLSQILNILISKKFPLPIFKSEYYMIDSFIAYYLLSIEEFSYNDIYAIISEILPKKQEKEFSFEKYYEQTFNTTYDNLFFKIYYNNFNEKMIYSYMLFIEYVITNFCHGRDYIKIGNRSVPYNKLRNSLVHSRWCINNDKIIFYDALTDVTNEINYNWQATIDFIDLCEYCTSILEEKKNQNNKYKIKKEKTAKINS